MAKILIIEDDATLQKVLTQYLIEEKFEVRSALDGEIGVKTAFSEKPDLILLDIILPKKDGYKVMEEIKANEQTKKIPILILTNLENIIDVEKALELGATTYMVKADYKLEDVAAKIKEILGMK